MTCVPAERGTVKESESGRLRTTMMSSCSRRLRMASCRSATAPRRSSSVVLPSLITFSTGKSLAVAQRSKCLYLHHTKTSPSATSAQRAYTFTTQRPASQPRTSAAVVQGNQTQYLNSLVRIGDQIDFSEELPSRRMEDRAGLSELVLKGPEVVPVFWGELMV